MSKSTFQLVWIPCSFCSYQNIMRFPTFMYVSPLPFSSSSVFISLPRPLKMQWVVKKKLRGLIKGLRGATCCVGSKHLRWRCSSPLDSSSLPFRDTWEFMLNLTHSFSVSLSLHLKLETEHGKRDTCGCVHCLSWYYVVFISVSMYWIVYGSLKSLFAL